MQSAPRSPPPPTIIGTTSVDVLGPDMMVKVASDGGGDVTLPPLGTGEPVVMPAKRELITDCMMDTTLEGI